MNSWRRPASAGAARVHPGQWKARVEKTEPVIRMRGIVKSFAGVRALNGITFDLYPGEIHCLVGENGAGKSTLMKILSGAYTPDSGEIEVGGAVHKTLSPRLSKQLGIEIIYQENLLVPTMSVVENIFVGCEESRAGFSDFKRMRGHARELSDELGISLDLGRRSESLSVSEQQYVKILKAFVKQPRILIMDEPTSMFNVRDAGRVLDMVERIAKKGISIIYISHTLGEVVKIADRITVLRDGAVVANFDNAGRDISIPSITKEMVGRSMEMFYTRERHEIGGQVLSVEGLVRAKDGPAVSFELRRGEILGFAGMVGSGRTEIIRSLIGADPRHGGRILLGGRERNFRKPAESIAAGIAYITEDRQKLGLMLGASIVENLTIVALDKRIPGYFTNFRSHVRMVRGVYDELGIRASSPMQLVRFLSGGNQQKVVLGKWLFQDADIYVLDEPTRGIDVGAKADFYAIMSNLVKAGKSIIMISSDMPELISMSDRILVVRSGQIIRELKGDEITEQNIITHALEVNKNG
jgi:ribose transport system ATP-binding protein